MYACVRFSWSFVLWLIFVAKKILVGGVSVSVCRVGGRMH